MKIRLYIWDNILPDWTSGVAFAAAKSVDQARKAILASFPQDNLSGLAVLAEQLAEEPAQVLDAPAGGYLRGGA